MEKLNGPVHVNQTLTIILIVPRKPCILLVHCYREKDMLIGTFSLFTINDYISCLNKM